MESMASLLSVKRPWYALNGEEQMDHQEWTLQCEDLSKEYQGGQAPCRAVREVNLTLHKGEILMIMWNSGAGKSTLIRMMDGLLSPTKGRVLFDGENIFDFSEKGVLIFTGRKQEWYSRTAGSLRISLWLKMWRCRDVCIKRGQWHWRELQS